MTEKIQFRGRRAIGWVDALRILACFMVVLAHCCDGFVAQFDSDPTAFYDDRESDACERAAFCNDDRCPAVACSADSDAFFVLSEKGGSYHPSAGILVTCASSYRLSLFYRLGEPFAQSFG